MRELISDSKLGGGRGEGGREGVERAFSVTLYSFEGLGLKPTSVVPLFKR